jgi:hypothetical protein
METMTIRWATEEIAIPHPKVAPGLTLVNPRGTFTSLTTPKNDYYKNQFYRNGQDITRLTYFWNQKKIRDRIVSSACRNSWTFSKCFDLEKFTDRLNCHLTSEYHFVLGGCSPGRCLGLAGRNLYKNHSWLPFNHRNNEEINS